MKYFKIAGLCLVSMFMIGTALAGRASAAALWSLCLAGSGTAEFSTDQCTEEKAGGGFVSVEAATTDAARALSFTLTLKDSGTALGTVEVQCWGGRSEGTVGPGSKTVVVAAKIENPETLCKGIKVCESGKVKEVAGVNLPWAETLTEGTENMARTQIEGSGGGAGWKVKCDVPIAGEETDECTSKSGEPEEVTFLNKVSSSVLLVLGRFLEARKSSCTIGNAASGSVSGLLGLVVARAPAWLLCLSGTGSHEFSTDQCTEEKAGGGFVSVEAATTDAARALSFTLTLKDSGTALGTVEVQCWGGRSEGTVGPGSKTVVVAAKIENPETLCKGLKVCESSKVKVVEGVHLPWTEILEAGTENMARTKIEGTDGGAGWKIECNAPIAGEETDECTSKSGEPEEVTFLNKVSSSVLLVLGRFLEARKSSCTIGNAASGSVSGLLGLVVARAPAWLLCLSGTGSHEFSTDQCTEEKAGGGFVSVEAATTDAARALSFTLTLKDSGTALGTVEVQCWGGRSEGTVGPGSKTVVVAAKIEDPEALCKGIKVCESSKVKVIEGVNLPWTEVLEAGAENTARTKIEGTGGGAGWKVKCDVPIAGEETDECTSRSDEPEEVTLLNKVSSSVLLVLGRLLEARKSSCTLGNSTSGSISGLFSVLLANGHGLSINPAGENGLSINPSSESGLSINL